MTSPRPVDPDRLRLMVITDRRLAGSRGVERVVQMALDAGAPAIQLREKELGVADILPLAQRLREMTRAAGALFIVNDRVDLALATGADGVHLGPDDLPLDEVRRYVGDSLLLGYSTDEPDRALAAEGEGADYLGCGTVWPTSSKEDAGPVIGPEGLARVAAAVSIPVLGIGGVTPNRSRELVATGAVGVAVVGAVMAAPNPGEAVMKLLRNVGEAPSSQL